MSVSLTIAASAVLLACVVYLSVTLIKAFLTFRRRTRVLYDLPGEPPHWLWGHLKMYPGPNDEGLAWQRQQTEKFPRVSIAWLGPFLPQVVVCHPDTVRLILKTSEPKGEMTYELIRPWVGDGLLLSKGHKWLRNRRLLTPAFHFDILKPYMAVNNQAADIFLSKVQSHSEKGEYFELFGDVSMYTLDVILRCAFSYNTDCQYLGDQHPYVKAVNDLSSLSTDRFFKPWFHNKFLYSLTPNGRKFQRACNFVHQVSENIVNRRKKELEAISSSETDKRKRYLDFLDILLTARDEEGAGLKDAEIRDEVDTFLFEGHDTTASAICWTLFSLAENPEHQTLIHREIEEILKGRQSKEILWEDLPKLTYLTMCIKEALRLHTPVSFIQRQTTQPLTVDGVTIPADTLFNVILYNVHHNPEIWEDSLEYRPERFSKEYVDNRDPYAFLPFSAGPRNCIGQNFAMHEIKVLIARVVYSFSLVADKSQKPSKSVEVVVRSKNGVWVKAVPRQSRD